MKRTAILLLALLALLPTGAQAAFPGRNGAIVYGYWGESITYDEDSGDVSTDFAGVAIRDGAQTHVLMHCSKDADSACRPFMYGAPAVSPDGRLVVMRAGDALAVIDVHGGTPRLLSHPGSSWDAPAFSPGGRRLVFESSSDGLAPSVWISDLDGGRAHRVVTEAHEPVWSTRNWIAFQDEEGAIARVRPSGRGLRRLVSRGEHPTWAPDGRHVAFVGLHSHRRGIFTMTGDGRHVRRIPFDGLVADVAWSPDGRRLLVAGEPRRSNATLLSIDLRTDVRTFYVRGTDSLEGFLGVDWQPLPR